MTRLTGPRFRDATARVEPVMRRLGLSFVRYFDHPNIPDGQSTRPHVLYQLDLAGPEPRSEHQ